MPLINLIQEQRTAAMRQEQQTRALFFTFVGVTVAGVVAFGALTFQTESLRSEEAKLLALAQRLKPLQAATAKAEQEHGRLSPRLKTLEDAQLATDRWARILAHLATNTPSDTWLTNIRTTVAPEPTTPVTVSLVGMSASQGPVSDFMLRTQNSQDLEGVDLKFTQEKTVGAGARAIEFEVAATIVGSAQPKPVVKEEKKEGEEKPS